MFKTAEFPTDVIEHMKQIIAEYENGRIVFDWHSIDLESGSSAYINEKFVVYLARMDNMFYADDEKSTDREKDRIADSGIVKDVFRGDKDGR